MPGGRPTEYNDGRPEELLEYMRQGYSKSAAAGLMGVAASTITEWAKVHPEFSKAVKKGHAMRVAELERRGLDNEGNATFSIFALKNASRVAEMDEWMNIDRVEHTGGDGGPVTVMQMQPIKAPDDAA